MLLIAPGCPAGLVRTGLQAYQTGDLAVADEPNERPGSGGAALVGPGSGYGLDGQQRDRSGVEVGPPSAARTCQTSVHCLVVGGGAESGTSSGFGAAGARGWSHCSARHHSLYPRTSCQQPSRCWNCRWPCAFRPKTYPKSCGRLRYQAMEMLVAWRV